MGSGGGARAYKRGRCAVGPAQPKRAIIRRNDHVRAVYVGSPIIIPPPIQAVSRVRHSPALVRSCLPPPTYHSPAFASPLTSFPLSVIPPCQKSSPARPSRLPPTVSIDIPTPIAGNFTDPVYPSTSDRIINSSPPRLLCDISFLPPCTAS